MKKHTHGHVARLPVKKGKRKYKRVEVRKDEQVDESVVMSGGMAWHSRYWAPRVDEADQFGSVTIYNADGKVMRTIAREQLLRPMPVREGNTWNNSLFPKRISDKV